MQGRGGVGEEQGGECCEECCKEEEHCEEEEFYEVEKKCDLLGVQGKSTQPVTSTSYSLALR